MTDAPGAEVERDTRRQSGRTRGDGRGRRAQSEVVGVVLMTAVVVLAVTAFGYYALGTMNERGDAPETNVEGRVTNHSVEFVHQGGDPLETERLRVGLSVNGTESGLDWNDGNLSGNDPDRFEPGERWWNGTWGRLHGDAVVEVWLIDEPSNTALFHDTLNPVANRSVR